MRARHVLVLAAALIALAGCSSSVGDEPADPAGLDDAAAFACTDFAKGYESATTTAKRQELANKVNKWAKTSKSDGIASNGEAMARGAGGTDDAWTLGADTFAQTCIDRGWTADTAK